MVVRDPAARICAHPLYHDAFHVLGGPCLPAGHVLNPVDLDELQAHFLCDRPCERRFSACAHDPYAIFEWVVEPDEVDMVREWQLQLLSIY